MSCVWGGYCGYRLRFISDCSSSVKPSFSRSLAQDASMPLLWRPWPGQRPVWSKKKLRFQMSFLKIFRFWNTKLLVSLELSGKNRLWRAQYVVLRICFYPCLLRIMAKLWKGYSFCNNNGGIPDAKANEPRCAQSNCRVAGYRMIISDHQQSWGYEEGPSKGSGPCSAGDRWFLWSHFGAIILMAGCQFGTNMLVYS